jgi:hypothetical protein
MKLRLFVGCAALAVLGVTAAQAQVIGAGWFEECRDFSNDPPDPQYSDDYGINLITNGIFGVSMGVSGTSTWGGPNGPCWSPARELDAAGRLSFFMGSTGSVQSSFDDGLALSMGAPTDPVGDFCYAIIAKDTNEPGDGDLFGDGGLRLAFEGASKRYMVGAWTDGEVDVTLTVRNVGDAAILWWDIVNLGTEVRPLGLLFGLWGGQHTSFGQFDSQTFTNQFFAVLGTNFGVSKLTQDQFTGYFVTPTTRPIRNDHRLPRTSNRFPSWVQFLAGQTEAYGLHVTNVPDASMRKLSPDPLNSNQFVGANTADLIRIGDHFFTLWNNNLRFNVFGDPTGTQEEADVYIYDHSIAQRYPVIPVAAGGKRRIIQVLKSSWGVSDYNDPYAAVVDAPRMINADPNGQDGLSPNPMTVRAYIDNQYAKLDQAVAMQSVRFVITLPTGLSLVAGETQEKVLGTVAANAIGFVEWQVESDGVTFGELPISITFAPTPGPQRTLSTSIRIAATPIIRLAAGAQMVTFPYTFPDNSLGAVLGLVPEVDFRAFKYDPGQAAYLPASVANRGESIWIVPASDQGFVTLQNASIPGDMPQGGLLYTLRKGWNMIGNPYNYAVALSDLVAVVDDAPSDSYTWQELVSNGFVSSALAYWDRGISGAGVGSYKFTTSQSTKLEPHKGYWIFVNTFNPIRLSWPPVLIPGLPNSGRGDETIWRQSERQYRVQLSARMANGADTDNYIGYVADPAKATQLQLPKPPQAQDAVVEVVVEGTVDGLPTRMAQALTDRKTKTEFTVHVNNREAGDVTVTWPNLASVPRNVRAKLTDVATGEVRDLRAVSGYTYFMSEPGTREFLVSIEQGGSVRPVIGNVIVGQAGGRGDSPMTISYALSASALVSVRVLSGSGKEVYTVTRGRADNAGENQVIWNLRDNANRAVAPGQYRVEILAETVDGERVRKIVPVNVIR